MNSNMAHPHGSMGGPDTESHSPTNLHRYGHPFKQKHRGDENMTRLMHININHFPLTHNRMENQNFRRFLDESGTDIVTLVEMNVNWKQIPAQDRLEYRTKGWWNHSRWSYSYNRHAQTSSRSLQGGTALLTIGDTTCRIWTSNLNDPTGLGRWTGTRYKGRGQRFISIVSAYKPHDNPGIATVGGQHETFLVQHNDKRKPSTAFLEDISQFIQKLQEKGDLIILNMDANDDLSNANSHTSQAIRELGLLHPMLDSFGPQLPNTYRDGTDPIDGMFISPALKPSAMGYLAFPDYGKSDHRVLWMDFKNRDLFGNRMPKTIIPSARRLQLNDPSVVERFISHYTEHIKTQQLPQKLAQLRTRIPTLTTEQREKAFDEIDRVRVKGILRAEKLCRKLKMGALYWTPELASIHVEMQLWTKAIKLREGRKIDTRHLRRLAVQCGSPKFWEKTKDQLYQKQKEVSRRYKDYRKKHTEKRCEFIQQLAERYEAHGKGEAKTVVRRIEQQEKIVRDNRLITAFTNTTTKKPLTRVIGPSLSDPTQREEYTNQKQIEQVCLNEGKYRFSQGHHTEGSQPEMYKAFGRYGEGDGVQKVLNGQIPKELENLPPDSYTKRFLPFLARPHTVSVQKWTYRAPEYKNSWKKMKERTSAGGKTHFGHMKAMISSEELTTFEADLASLPYEYGFAPPRWRPVINCFIEKKPNNYNVEKLRIIMLIAPEANHNNKVLGRMTMEEAERSNTMPPEQGGSRKGRDVNGMSLPKVFTFDIARQHLTPGALCSNDAKSCYDRILLHIASLCLQKAGAPKDATEAMLRIIYKWAHRVRTAFGESKAYFEADKWHIPIHGIGQGNGAGPTIWAVISAPMMEFLRANNHGIQWKTPLTEEDIHVVAFAFVDDCDLPTLIMNNHEPPTPRIQQALNDWGGALNVTGGALVPSKSFWYYIHPTLTNEGRIKYLPPPHNHSKLYMRNDTGNLEEIERVPCNEGRRTLGVRICPDGNMNEQFKHMRQQSKDWAHKIMACHLPRELVWQAFTTRLMKSLEFPLAATTLTEKQCHAILAPAIKVALQKSGVVGTLPIVVRHGPLSVQGFGARPLYTTQGIRHISRLLQYDTTGTHAEFKLLRVTLQTTQIETGCMEPFWEHPYTQYKDVITPTWVTHTWHFCEEIHATFDGPLHHPMQYRTHDTNLVDQILHYTTDPRTRRLLNWNRLFLQIRTTGELFDASGKRLRSGIWEVQKRHPTTLSEWPYRPHPPKASLLPWQTFLQETFNLHPRYHTTELPSVGQPTEQWEWWYNTRHNILYHQHKGKTMAYYSTKGKRTTRHKPTFDPTGEPVAHTVDKGLPVTVTLQSNLITLDGQPGNPSRRTTQAPDPTPYPRPLSVPPFLAEYDVPMEWAWVHIDWPDNWTQFLQNLCSCTPTLVSDGSFKDDIGTATAVLWAKDDCLKVTFPIPGRSEDQSPYRSECGGIHVGQHLLSAIWRYYDLPPQTIHIGCDGESALKRSFDTKPIGWNAHARDIIYATRRQIMRNKERLTLLPKHVHGHQDKEATKWNVLPLAATLNVWADSAAGAYREYLADMKYDNFQIPLHNEPWILRLRGQRITTHIEEAIVHEKDATPLLNYWNKRRFTDSHTDRISWEPLHTAMRQTDGNTKRRVLKWAARVAPVGENMLKRQEWTDDKCPRCSQPETHHHFLWCPEAKKTWNISLRRFHLWLLAHHTSPMIAKAIVDELSYWHTPEGFPPVHNTTIQRAVDLQRRLGWQEAIYGCWAHSWIDIQQNHFDHGEVQYKGHTWLTRLIKRVWQIAWDMWDHRNGVLHKSTILTTKLKLYDEIETQYNLGFRDFRPSLRRQLRLPLTDLLTKKVGFLELWLQRVKTERQHLQNDPTLRTIRQQRASLALFLRLRSHNHPTTQNTHTTMTPHPTPRQGAWFDVEVAPPRRPRYYPPGRPEETTQ